MIEEEKGHKISKIIKRVLLYSFDYFRYFILDFYCRKII